MPHLGFQELLIIFLIVLVIFGASKLPQLGRGLGEGIKNFRKGMRDGEDEPSAKGSPGDDDAPTGR
jgi:sec-independent protein translocase protein TatA